MQLSLTLAWTALAVWPTGSEQVKLAGLLAGTAAMVWSLRHLVLPRGTLLVLAALVIGLAGSSCLALEPAVWLGSHARAQGVLTALAGVLLALVAASLDAVSRARVIGCMALIGAALGAYALLQRAGLDPIAWQYAQADRAAATLGNANVLAGWLLLSLPLSADQAWRARRDQRWAWLLVLLQAAGLVATGSRAALLALALPLAVVLALRRSWRLGLGVLAGLLIAGVLALSVRPDSVRDRVDLWRAAGLALVDQRPLTDLHGSPDAYAPWRPWLGFGADLQAAPLQRALAEHPRRDGASGWQADRAHQWWLDLALQSGVLGAVLALWLGGLVLRALWLARGQPVSAALTLALAAWWLHQQLGFGLTADRMLAWVLVGWALQPSAAPRLDWRLPAWLRATAAATLLALASAALGTGPAAWLARVHPAWLAERHFAAGQQHYLQAKTASAAQAAIYLGASAADFEQAASLRPFDRDAAIGAASAWVEAAAVLADPQALARARRWCEAAAQLDPSEPRLAPLDARIEAVAAALPPMP